MDEKIPTKKINLEIPATEKEMFEQLAKKHGLTLTAYFRMIMRFDALGKIDFTSGKNYSGNGRIVDSGISRNVELKCSRCGNYYNSCSCHLDGSKYPEERIKKEEYQQNLTDVVESIALKSSALKILVGPDYRINIREMICEGCKHYNTSILNDKMGNLSNPCFKCGVSSIER